MGVALALEDVQRRFHALEKIGHGLLGLEPVGNALLEDPDLAWRSLAVALLAEELGEGD